MKIVEWAVKVTPTIVKAVMAGKGKQLKEALRPYLSDEHLEELDSILEDPAIDKLNEDIDDLLR